MPNSNHSKDAKDRYFMMLAIEQAKRGEIDLEEHPYYEDYDQEF